MIKRYMSICLVALLMVPASTQLVAGQDKVDGPTKSKLPANPAVQLKTQAYLGVGVTPLHPALASQLAETIGDGRGIMIANVADASPAAKAGLQVHDVLVAFDQHDIYSTEQLVKLIRDSEPGSKISLTVVRHGKLEDVTVELGQVAVQPSAGRQTTFRVPFSDRFPRPELFSRDLMLKNLGDPENWSHFESLQISKDKDGKYEAKITFKDEDQSLERTFVGTRDEIVQAIEEDKDLPQNARDHLLRGLDMKLHVREIFDPERFFQRRENPTELFNWPELDF